MNFAANYHAGVALQEFDEIIIEYNGQSEALKRLLEQYSDKKVILAVNDPAKFFEAQEDKILNSYYIDYPNFIVRFYDHHKFYEYSSAILQRIKERMLAPYFFGGYVANFDQLHYMFTTGASEVYLVEEICFDLMRAKSLCTQHGVQVRAFPNVAQSSTKSTPALKKFFIRPEDIDIYSEVIDTLEFYTDDLMRQNILLKIYKRGKWHGDLNPLILDLNLTLESSLIEPEFGRMRRSCARKCMRGEACRACENIQYIHDKKKEFRSVLFN